MRTMSDTIKTILSIVAILLIGYLAGYHSHRYTVKNRLKQIARERIEPGFSERLLQTLQIEEPRKGEIEPILRTYGSQLISLRRHYHAEAKPVMDSLRIRLQDKLTAEELKTLDRVIWRMRRGEMKKEFQRRGKKERQQRSKNKKQ